MKRLIFSLIAMLTLLGWDLHAQGTYSLAIPGPAATSYGDKTYMGEGEWKATNAATIVTTDMGGNANTFSVTLNGKKGGKGTLTSSNISTGLGTLSFKYGLPYVDKTYNLEIKVTPANGEPIVRTISKSGLSKGFNDSFSEEFNVNGSFTITFTNTSSSTNTKNTDRYAIWDIQWTGYSSGTASTVTFNPAQTEQHNPFELTLTAEEGKTILYSLDGSEPSTTYTAPISITAASTTVKAKIEGTDEVVEKTYTITTAVPEIKVEGPTYGDKTVSITSSNKDAKIYYTTDGTEPSTASTEYTKPFILSEQPEYTVKAIAVTEAYGTSAVTSEKVSVGAANPVTSPEPGTYDNIPLEIALTSASSKAKIYYLLNPTSSDRVDQSSTLYTKPISIDRTTTIKAVAYLGNNQSQAKTFEFKIDAVGTSANLNFTEDAKSYFDGEWEGKPEDGLAAYPDSIEMNGIILRPDFKDAKETSRFRLWWSKNNQGSYRITKAGAEAGQTLTFVAPEGQQITGITITGQNMAMEFNTGAAEVSGSEATWSGSASEVILTPKNTSTMSFYTITVECGESLAPVFNWNTGTYYEPFDLAISTGLQNGKIAYTIDGSDPVVSYNATEKKWVIGNGTEYSAPIAIKANTTIKAVAYGQRENPVNHIVENYVSDINAATYTFGQVDALPKEVDCLYRLLDWFTTWEAADETNGFKLSDKVTYPNINKTVQLPFAMMLTACSNEVAYMDDNFLPDYNSGIAIRRPNTPWADLYKVNDVFNEGMIVSFEWENEVTPSLVLHNVPSLYQYDTDPVAVPTMTVDSLLATAAWNEQDIYNGKVHNEWLRTQLTEVDKDGKKVTVNPTGFTFIPAADLKITLLNPTTVNEIVTLTDVEFSKATRANKGNNPTASFTGKGKEGGKSVTFITRFPIKSYAPGTYDVTGIVGYDIEIVTGNQDVWDETAKKDVKKKVPVDTIVSAVLYPVSMTAKGQTGEITEGTFELADAPAEGKMLLAAADMAFASLAENKKYGWMPIQEVTDENGVIKTNPDLAVTLEPTDGDAFFMKDVYGRYIYQTGSFNNFNVSAELPENTEEATWTFEPSTDENGNTAWFIANMATQKFIQYSTSHKSYGCYPEMQADGVLPRIYSLTGTSTGITEALAPEADGAVEVFNLQGIRLGNSTKGLPAGMYIIRQGRTATKVMLR